MKVLDVLDLRAQISHVCVNAIAAGIDPVTVSVTLGSVNADLLLQGTYRALNELQEETDKKKQEEDTNV